MGIATIMVLAFHFRDCFSQAPLDYIARVGYGGVDIFLFLSGLGLPQIDWYVPTMYFIYAFFPLYMKTFNKFEKRWERGGIYTICNGLRGACHYHCVCIDTEGHNNIDNK